MGAEQPQEDEAVCGVQQREASWRHPTWRAAELRFIWSYLYTV